jgi:hypothetical protein
MTCTHFRAYSGDLAPARPYEACWRDQDSRRPPCARREAEARHAKTRRVGFDHFADASLLSSEIHRRAHEIALAELDAAMAQDVIRRCAVKIEVR